VPEGQAVDVLRLAQQFFALPAATKNEINQLNSPQSEAIRDSAVS
jgi:isopenicillin N synthase-like dioxygenase